MVALQVFTLFGLLPALALGAFEGRHVQPHVAAVRRSRVQPRSPAGVVPVPARRAAGAGKRGGAGSCRVRPTPAHNEADAASTVVAAADDENAEAPVEQPIEQPTEQPAEQPTEQPAEPTPQPEQPAASPSQEPQPSPTPEAPPAEEKIDPAFTTTMLAHSNNGLLKIDGTCGPCPSTPNEPNGAQWWLDCGLDDGGWAPPHITLDQVVYTDLTGEGIFAPCTQFFDQFYRYGGEFGIPPIMLAAIALQESTCRPWLVGGIGEQGLMQLLGVNCDGAPGGNCQDVDFNIRRGAEYLRGRIDAHGGSLLAGLGAYNGWRVGITAGEVYQMKNDGRCWAQPNLDYMHQMLNGWLQGKAGYELGKWFNRNDC
ncbi:hypothetical protein CcaverHIS002_0304010 [Cutaneotrichosporon cavernicola]|uniref:Transglycosylase SLT domain-containing protein n=1 Tax=Cutaneotrichosporon cavernicola TaxID=279322 RepID=A0AA48I619_9TREE|nr:uncharacterized protein CcaverHIS019_0303990 [Cutaneotrichosporon cavernicola]BEI82533.1 hypothetical protein CcaverHIS002_0304010 [Cutaneotrichosporon cavernicola]BEI90329.1 hypothetical protein CcaverHIS019_0303990 [Cutaneotrichosporon cavernicola]BEI98105.1 hypothetical protein CcaverHIS631_0304040 [Cutaneotrichosporon cavernicola]BEJ05882.1 hypothetical protein CcaverHIS641_0304040 [Cutaneotrichosporon cavernicola]